MTTASELRRDAIARRASEQVAEPAKPRAYVRDDGTLVIESGVPDEEVHRVVWQHMKREQRKRDKAEAAVLSHALLASSTVIAEGVPVDELRRLRNVEATATDFRRGKAVGPLRDAEREIARLTAELEVTRKAMVEAGICIEALLIAGTDSWHSETLRRGLRQARDAIRAAIAKPGDTPAAVE